MRVLVWVVFGELVIPRRSLTKPDQACSIWLWRLSANRISSPNYLPCLVLIVIISGLGMPWISLANISSFILFYRVVLGFHQTVYFWNKQKPTAVFVLTLAIKLWFARLSGAESKWKGKAVHALHRSIHGNLGTGLLAKHSFFPVLLTAREPRKPFALIPFFTQCDSEHLSWFQWH